MRRNWGDAAGGGFIDEAAIEPIISFPAAGDRWGVIVHSPSPLWTAACDTSIMEKRPGTEK